MNITSSLHVSKSCDFISVLKLLKYTGYAYIQRAVACMLVINLYCIRRK